MTTIDTILEQIGNETSPADQIRRLAEIVSESTEAMSATTDRLEQKAAQLHNHEAAVGTALTLGHVRAGSGIEILSDGTLNVALTDEGVVRRPLSETPLAGAIPVAGADGTLKKWFPHTAFVGQWVFLRQNPLPVGYVMLDGTLYTGAADKFPELLAYIVTHKDETTTEADWKARQAAASGTGGVPFYVYNEAANTLRMPDTRGDSPYYGTPGTWQGDAMRNITGTTKKSTVDAGAFIAYGNNLNEMSNGAFVVTRPKIFTTQVASIPAGNIYLHDLSFDASRTVPVSGTNHPRRIGLTMAVYAGIIGA